MAISPLARLLSHGRSSSGHLLLPVTKFTPFIALRHLSASPLPRSETTDDSPVPSLSARLSFVFDQIDAIDRDRAAKEEALQRIRSWRQSRVPPPQRPPSSEDSDSTPPTPSPLAAPPTPIPLEARDFMAGAVDDAEMENSDRDMFRKELELVHPWPEWIELMERLGQQNYFDFRRTDVECIVENEGIGFSAVKDETDFDFSRDWITVRNACMNFGRDRFDILKSLSRKDLQILVGYGCPSMDPKVVFSAKLLRKLVHVDEGDVCSSCNLRSSCSRGYILPLKEDEARTLDVIRILLTYGFDHINGSVENKSLLKIKSLKTVIRKLLHEVVKLSAVPIDPNLPPPVIKKPPPKVKQPPTPPKKRVGRDDVEMKKGDWLCTKCDFMNFAKNTVCLQCDAKRPKRQLLPGEWECPQCNFLNYRRNMACFHCDHKRPPDEYTENQMEMKQPGSRTGLERNNRIRDISNAWNFDFDDNESDGADVATHECADSPKLKNQSNAGFDRGFQGGTEYNDRTPRISSRDRYFNGDDDRKAMTQSDRAGFDDFDDEEDDVDSYELDGSNCTQTSQVSRRSYSELEKTSESEDFDEYDQFTKLKKSDQDYLSGSDDDSIAEHPYQRSSHARDTRQQARGRGNSTHVRKMSFVSDNDDELLSDFDDIDDALASGKGKGHKKSLTKGGRISDSDDDFLYDDHENKPASGGSRKEFETYDWHKSRTSSNSPSRGGSIMHRKGSPRDGYSRFRENEGYPNFHGSGNKNESKFRQPGRSRDSPRSDGYGRFRENEEYQKFNRLGNKNESRIRQHGRSRDSPRSDGYGRSRENEEYQKFNRLGNKNESRTRQYGRSRDSPRSDGYGRSRENEEYQNFNRLGDKNESRIRQPGRSRDSPRSRRNFDEDKFD